MTGTFRRARGLSLWAPVGVYMLVIFVVSAQHEAPIPDDMSDTQGHSLGYFGLGAVMTRAVAGGLGRPVTWIQGLTAFALSTAYGASDEWHQSFVPGRTSDWRDLRADAVGAALGTAACSLWGIIRSRSAR